MRRPGVGGLVAVVALHRAGAVRCCTVSWVLYTTFKFGWGPRENGWSLFTVGVVAVVVQGVLLGRLLKRFGASGWRFAGLVVVDARLPAATGWRPQGWMMYAIIVANFLCFTRRRGAAEHRSRSAADATTQGQTMGAVTSLNSLMAVLAPLISAPLLGPVAHLPPGDWRIGAPFYFCALLQGAALAAGLWRHFRRVAIAATARHRSLTRQPPCTTRS